LEWRRKAQHRELRTLPNSCWRRAENKFLQVLVEALMRSAQANAQQNFEATGLPSIFPARIASAVAVLQRIGQLMLYHYLVELATGLKIAEGTTSAKKLRAAASTCIQPTDL
jgi:hypothetical protein